VEERLPEHKVTVVGGELRTKEEAANYLCTGMIRAGLVTTACGVRLNQHTESGHEVKTIVAFAEKHRVDLLVVGFMSHSKIFGENWGSTSQNLTRLAPCSVLVVK
jgi:nucleotide-binding universal stress UspA family protein